MRKTSMKRTASARTREPTAYRAPTPANPYDAGSSSYSSTPEHNGVYAVPQSSVPRRSSSLGHAKKPSQTHSRKPSIPVLPPVDLPSHSIPNRGGATSPVKQVREREDAITTDVARRWPSKTFIRTPVPVDILEAPTYKHPLVKLELQVSAPLFVGGGTLEGHLRAVVDDGERYKSRRTLGLGHIAIDLLGFEELYAGSRQASFLSLGTDLIDSRHPPPATMIEPNHPLTPGDNFWTLAPSASSIPFLLTLPLDTGPPPFESRYASIRFLLSATAVIRDAGNHYRVRTSCEVHVLPTYDPEKALMSLPVPLTATDELVLPRSAGQEKVKITAGLHRQVWVSGSTLFADVHVSNKCRTKHVRRLDLWLERDILCYKHAPASSTPTTAMAAQARVFETKHTHSLTSTSLRAGKDAWPGVPPCSSATRTCDLDLPRGHASVRCGRFFEVRFFLNITATLGNSKTVAVQLPIVLVHMNSLDVVPNSVEQVARAVEAKRAQARRKKDKQRPRAASADPPHRSVSSPSRMQTLRPQRSYTQGRAFAAPRQHFLDRQRSQRRDLADLGEMLDHSPRKHLPSSLHAQPRAHPATLPATSSSSPALRSTPEPLPRGPGAEDAFQAMVFRSPHPSSSPSTVATHTPRSIWGAGGEAEGVASIRARMRRMASLESVGTGKPRGPQDWGRSLDGGHDIATGHPGAGGGMPTIPAHALGLGSGFGLVRARSVYTRPSAETRRAGPRGGEETRAESRMRPREDRRPVRRKESRGRSALRWLRRKRSGRDDERAARLEFARPTACTIDRLRDASRHTHTEGWI